MSQRYKSIYFTDHPAESPQQRNLTLALGAKDRDLYQHIHGLSSQELRELLGYSTYSSLQAAAEDDGLAVNTYCVRILRQKVGSLSDMNASYSATVPQLPPVKSIFDPVQATFKGGEAEPLHGWYPYLEAYSPDFVRQVVREFAPTATAILDPFSGSGTTPLTVAGIGKLAYYCEINPLLQLLTEVKHLAVAVPQSSRERLAEYLSDVADRTEEFLRDAPPDARLRTTYHDTFGDSAFFDGDVFVDVLRARAAIDHAGCSDPLAAKFLTVAFLACLLPVSRLIRRGDVRFKTSREQARGRLTLAEAVRVQLTRMVEDLVRLVPVTSDPVLVCEDARRLGSIPSLNVEAVITSPPYLNGTNYFRNTKVELWFLRCLTSASDLSKYRYRAVTAGINDVTVAKPTSKLGNLAEEVVSKLERTAYDQRIPRMVATYFADMSAIFGAIGEHLVDGAPVLVDIGDSRYANIHVPTDALLVEILAERGFALDHEVTLRKRMSRGGATLRQVLLVFRYQKRQRILVAEKAYQSQQLWPRWTFDWMTFKESLPHQQGDFAKRNWGHPLHSLCSYQGKMKPSLASHLVETFVPAGGTVLDPFAGVGTIPFEGALHGTRTWGFEISPSALHIAAAKVGRPDRHVCNRTIQALEACIQETEMTEAEVATASAIHFNGPLSDYFHPETFREILLARRFFLQHPPQCASESLVFAALLHILHGNRPYALSRRSHPITPFAPTGPSEYRGLIAHLQDKVARSLDTKYPKGFQPGQILFQDATGWWPQEINDLDAIITSPPFFDSTRFYLANWMRLWFSGWEAADFKVKPLAFVDERQKASFRIYESIFRQARERLKPGGVMVLHLGKSRKCDMAQALSSVAKRWFRIADVFSESVEHCESHGIRDKGTVEEHTYLVLT